MSREHRFRFRSAPIALLVAAALHVGVAWLILDTQALQFTLASGARSRPDPGVVVTLVSTARPTSPRADTVPPQQTQTQQPPMHPPLATAPPTPPAQPPQRPVLPTSASTRSLDAAPAAAAAAAAAAESAAAVPEAAAPTPAPPPQLAAAAPSARSPNPDLPGAAQADPRALSCRVPQPPYPPRAKRLQHEGTVMLRVTVTATGEVTQAQVAATSGHESLDEAALNAARNARCKPGLTGGEAETTVVAVPVRFSISN